jgi:hypothetical protein
MVVPAQEHLHAAAGSPLARIVGATDIGQGGSFAHMDFVQKAELEPGGGTPCWVLI